MRQAEHVTEETREPANVWSKSVTPLCKPTGNAVAARELSLGVSVDLVQRGEEKRVRVLLSVTLQLCTGVPHGIKHGNRPKRGRVVVVKLIKRAVHLAAHAAAFSVWRCWCAVRRRVSNVGFAHIETPWATVGTDMAVVPVAEKVCFEQGVVNKRLEDGREETRLGEIEERT